jgi:hypothetical protein
MILSFRFLFNNTFCHKSVIFYVYHVHSCVQLVIALSFIRNMSIVLGLASRPGAGRIKKGVWMPSKGKILGPTKLLISLVSELLYRVWSCRDMKVASDLHLAQRLRMSRVTLLLSSYDFILWQRQLWLLHRNVISLLVRFAWYCDFNNWKVVFLHVITCSLVERSLAFRRNQRPCHQRSTFSRNVGTLCHHHHHQ